MYELLTDRLRALASKWWATSGLSRTLHQAADAIENLQHQSKVLCDGLQAYNDRVGELMVELEKTKAALEKAKADNARLNNENFWLTKEG